MSEPAAKPRPMIDLDEFERRLRRPAAAQPSQDDPLAELARLVGGHEDPFKVVFEQGGRPGRVEPTVAPLAARASPPAYADDDFMDEPGFHGTIHPQAYQRAEQTAAPQGGYYPPSAEAEDYAWPESAAPAAPMAQQYVDAPRSKRPLFAMAAIIMAGILGIGVSFAYKSKSGPHEIAMIQAPSGPTKIQPDSPGGLDVPNQDASILNKTPQPTPTKLANHEEQPVDLATQPMAPASRAMASDMNQPVGTTGAASVPVPVPPAGTQAPAVQQDIQSFGIGALIEPKRVKTVSVRSDGTLLPNDTPPQMPASAAPAPHPAAPPVAATPPKPASTPKSTARVVTTPKPAQSLEQLADAGNTAPEATPPAAAAPAPAKPKPAPVKPVKVATTEDAPANQSETSGSGGFAVQLAAPGSEQEAHELTSKLTAKFGSDLSGHHLTYHRVKVGDKTVFRVRSGGLSREEATSICQKVQSSGGSCFVAKN